MCVFFVSIDTSYLEQKSFDFNKEEFKSLAKLCQNNKVRFVLSDVVLRETKAHISDKVKDHISTAVKQVEKIKKYFNDREINDKDIIEKLKILDVEDLTNEKINCFLSATNCQIISSADIKADEVLSMHFKKAPPFSEKKKNEFKDAYILLSCRDYMDDKKEDLYIISTDPDWGNFSLKHKKIKAFQDLNTVLDIINRKIYEKEILISLEKYFDKFSVEFPIIKDDIKDFLYTNINNISILFSVSSVWGYQNVEDIEYSFEDFNFKENEDKIVFNLLNIDNDVITISCPIKLKFHVDGNIPLYFFDREDCEDIPMANAIIDDNIHFKSSIIIKLKRTKDELSIEDVSLSQEHFDIDLGWVEPDAEFYE